MIAVSSIGQSMWFSETRDLPNSACKACTAHGRSCWRAPNWMARKIEKMCVKAQFYNREMDLLCYTETCIVLIQQVAVINKPCLIKLVKFCTVRVDAIVYTFLLLLVALIQTLSINMAVYTLLRAPLNWPVACLSTTFEDLCSSTFSLIKFRSYLSSYFK